MKPLSVTAAAIATSSPRLFMLVLPRTTARRDKQARPIPLAPSSRFAGPLSRAGGPVNPAAARRQGELALQPRPQVVHVAAGIGDVADVESAGKYGAECFQPLPQNTGVSRAAVRRDDEAALFLVAQIPGNRFVARERGREIELDVAVLEPRPGSRQASRLVPGRARSSRGAAPWRASAAHRSAPEISIAGSRVSWTPLKCA